MADTRKILIESILGGHSPMSHFAGPDQFRHSIGVDPALPINDATFNNSSVTTDSTALVTSGLLRPSAYVESFSTNGIPTWIVNPAAKLNSTTDVLYVYDSVGSVYTMYSTGDQTLTPFDGDLNDGGTASGNGAEYYDNYVYFARDTTIARWGPLSSGSRSFTDDYWSATLGKTALTNTAYPIPGRTILSNHIMHRHSDGRLYIADVVGNQGTIHYIATTKTTVEGDTDNGSTFNALQVGYGLWPTAMESYGSDLVVAFIESVSTGSTAPRAKIAFWDTTSQNFNKITWVEFPDNLITGIKNINGVLYVVSSSLSGPQGTSINSGFRVTRFVGGYTFEEVAYVETGDACAPGALEGRSNRLLFGTSTLIPYYGSGNGVGCVYSLGLQKKGISTGLFNIMGSTDSNSIVTALALKPITFFRTDQPIVGIQKGFFTSGAILAPTSTSYNNQAQSLWWSQVYRIGQPFKITKVRFPLGQAVSGNMQVNPTFYIDDGEQGQALEPINTATFNGKRNAIYRPNGLTGEHNFWVELKWMGASLCTVGLPISIEYELLED